MLPRILATESFELPVANGLRLHDGRWFALHGSPCDNLQLADRDSLAPPCDDAGMATLYPGFEARAEDGRLVIGGGGAFEAEGFLALFDAGMQTPRWLLYCDCAEIFVSATFEAGGLVAMSEDYPFRYRWTFDDAMPPSLRVKRIAL
ncbi:hypothetical protein [Lysobacter capsici]|uniref:hypothetical protein n=1 Tax=Lysobacter capsici TaxID=435897 RepID=UPI001C00353D|nr:hypothetical protein [Lysobacter capsici]QWF18603.1 hypothetical protein KME82_07610 [Lysobacter capsici]